MSQPTGFADKIGVIWGVADLLRGDFKAHEYGQVILPLVVLRRLECALEPTKTAVVEMAEKLGDSPGADAILRRTAGGHRFYNTSKLDLTSILNDAGTAAANLRTYIAAFSPGAREVLDAYRFEDKIGALDKAGLLYQVLAKFADLDLTEESVPNDSMGYIFEELLRKFSEMSNETAGEHFTPREVIRLMVNILFVEDDKALAGAKPVRTLYDPACGTGGMLTVAQEHMKELNPNGILEVYGQELNPETWAVCRSDLMIKGQDPARIVLGNSLTDEDGHPALHADYALANPPFGVDWKKYADKITAEKDKGDGGRYAAGLPRVSDGSLLFLQHMISKFKPVTRDPETGEALDGGSRMAIVFSGSPLFSGSAGSGESEIRRRIIENDLLEGIVALPDQLFYNTGIGTYFWVLTNRKSTERRGKVVLVDARDSFSKMRKSLGDKRKFITDDQIAEITRLYHEALDLDGEDERVRVLANEDLGYRRITVERPLRRRWEVTEKTIEQVKVSKAYLAGKDLDRDALNSALFDLLGASEDTEAAFLKRLLSACTAHRQVGLPAAAKKAVLEAAAVADPDAPVVLDKKGQPLPDADLRDNENVPLAEDVDAYVAREVLPHVPDAWVDHGKTKVGYEIPLTRYFYRYTPPRPLAEIDAELDAVEREIQQVLTKVAR
jgi:type I restriction enzyme M protein